MRTLVPVDLAGAAGLRKPIAQEDGQPNQQNADYGGERADDQLQVGFLVEVAAQSESDGNRSRPYGQRHGEG